MRYTTYKKNSRIWIVLKKLVKFLFGEQIETSGGHWKKVHYLEKWED